MALIPARYSLDNLRRALEQPGMILGELDHLGTKANIYAHSYLYNWPADNVMEEDWDSLLLLDGCRYDTYSEVESLEGDLQSRYTAGSESWEFMCANFRGRQFHDTVYVTANPHAYKLEDTCFHDTITLLDSAWDPELQTVPPEAVAAATREAHERYPHKRLLVHFMQPHFPFIGPLGQQIDQGGIVHQFETGAEPPGEHALDDSPSMMIWGRLERRLVSRDVVNAAYRENLELVLEEAEELLGALDGKTVLSSDHGNLLGERLRPIPTRGFGHPSGLASPGLRKVPWQVIPADTRRSVTAESPVESAELDGEVAQQRLEALGYVE